MPYQSEMIPRLEELARRAAEPLGVDVAWIEFKQMGASWFFRVFIDRESGVGLSECEAVSERLGVLLDVEDPIDSSYTLEVSSPGLDRPLWTRQDYERFTGRLARVQTKELFDGRRRFKGKLAGWEGDNVLVEDEGGVRSIPWSAIESGRLEVEMFQPRRAGGSRRSRSASKAGKRR